jgi:hypothetical protein
VSRGHILLAAAYRRSGPLTRCDSPCGGRRDDRTFPPDEPKRACIPAILETCPPGEGRSLPRPVYYMRMRSADNDDSESQFGFTIRWGALTISLLIVTIVSLGTLVTVVSIKDVDTLSVVALALAVLAFAAQLIVSLTQASAGAQQVAQTERINADTQSLLSEIRATAESLLTNQKDIFTRVLRAALPEVAREISDETSEGASIGASIDAEELEARLVRAVDRGLQNLSTAPRRTVADEEVLKNGRLATLYKYPTHGDDSRYMEKFRSLSPEAAVRLTHITKTITRRFEQGQGPVGTIIIRAEKGAPDDIVELVTKQLITTRPPLSELDSATRMGTGDTSRLHLRVELTQTGMEVMSLTFGRFR